jgi:diguanylate cyclase (GGDEF)-like protein
MRVNGNWMLGSLKDLPALIKKYDIGIILSAGPAATREANEYIFDLCQTNNIRLFFLNDLMLMVDRQITQPQGSFEYPVWLDERLEFKAMHNAITGLPNRFLFQDRLKHSIAYAKRYKTQVAVLLVKINGMDDIIEKIGRKYGDMILMKTAERLSKCERESDTLAYVAENIFAVILQNISDASAAEIVANKMFASLAEPFTVEKLGFQLSADVKVFTGANGFDDLEALCKTEIKMAFAPTPKPEVLNWYDNAIDE